MYILGICALTCVLGIGVGIFFSSVLHLVLGTKYDGTIFFEIHPDEKIVYTFEINSDLDKLRFKKDVLFKVDEGNAIRE